MMLPSSRGAQVLISAHRFGAGKDRDLENSLAALEASLALGVDYVEFDVQRCNDGTYVVAHDSWIAVGDHHLPISALTPAQVEVLAGTVVRYDDVLARIRAGRGPHRPEVHLARRGLRRPGRDLRGRRRPPGARSCSGSGQLVVTTNEDRAVRAVRDWADAEGHELLVGLSLGRSVRGLSWRDEGAGAASRSCCPGCATGSPGPTWWWPSTSLARLGRGGVRPPPAAAPRWSGPSTSEEALRYWLRPGPGVVGHDQPARPGAGGAVRRQPVMHAGRGRPLRPARCGALASPVLPFEVSDLLPSTSALRRRRTRLGVVAAPWRCSRWRRRRLPAGRDSAADRVALVLECLRDVVGGRTPAAAAATGGEDGEQGEQCDDLLHLWLFRSGQP